MFGWSIVIAAGFALSAVVGAWMWRRGKIALSLAPFAGSMAIAVLVLYGAMAPARNPLRSHRDLASRLQQVLPDDVGTVMFFHEIDEGLWYYLEGRRLRPVPGSNPDYNDGLDLMRDYWNNTLVANPQERIRIQMQLLTNWLDQPASRRESPYVLLRADRYDVFADELASHARLIFREGKLERNELVLLRALDPPRRADGPAGEPVASAPDEVPATSTRR